MEEQHTKDTGGKKRTLQQISVPFLWEDKPGIAKKEWTPNSLSTAPQLQIITPPPPPPPPPPGALLPSRPPPPPPAVAAKFIVSVPFKWEEKPGTPIRTFAKGPSLAAKNKSLPLPPAYYSQLYECFESDQESSFEDDDEEEEEEEDDEDDLEDPDWLMELDQDVETKSSAPSLLANRIVPASTISSAIPFKSSYQHTEQTPSSPDSGSSTSNYATGNTSPVGNSFLEQLFPLYTPKADSPGKLACFDLEKSGLHEAAEPKIKGLRGADERGIVIRRPQTLGELIMLSRRRSYLQIAVMTRKNSVSKEFEDPSANGCCMFGSGNSRIAKLLGGKSLLTLKFA